MPKTSKIGKPSNIELILEYLSSRMSDNSAVYFKEFRVVQRFKTSDRIPPQRRYDQERLADAIKNVINKYYKKEEADCIKKKFDKKHIFYDLEILKIISDDL